MLQYFKDLLKREAARVTTAIAAAAVGAVAALDAAVDAISLSPEFMVAVGVAASALAMEVIRHLVWSQEAVEALKKSDVPVTGAQSDQG